MTFEVFLSLLFAVSILTSLCVEGLKKFIGNKFSYSANVLAGITAIVLGVIVGVFYCILAGVAFNVQIAVYLIALVLLSWLCAMLGYDKVVQALLQIKAKK